MKLIIYNILFDKFYILIVFVKIMRKRTVVSGLVGIVAGVSSIALPYVYNMIADEHKTGSYKTSNAIAGSLVALNLVLTPYALYTYSRRRD